jgi:tRNA A37 methylthiotransferase MiaB
MRLTPSSFSYLRIGEGCDHTCTFCAIPSIAAAAQQADRHAGRRG